MSAANAKRYPVSETPIAEEKLLSFPALASFLDKLHWKHGDPPKTRAFFQSTAACINRATRDTQKPAFLINRILAIANESPNGNGNRNTSTTKCNTNLTPNP